MQKAWYDIFMVKCTSLEQIENKISELFEKPAGLLYRGHDHDLSPCATNGCPQAGVPQQDKKCECDRFVMVPSLYRIPGLSVRVSDPKEIKRLECDLIKDASDYDGSFPLELQKIEFIQQLFNKSIFLDVCHNLYPAVFFACYNVARWTGGSGCYQDKDASIFLIDRSLNKLVQASSEIKRETKTSRLIDTVNRYDSVCFYWDPNNRTSDINEEIPLGLLGHDIDMSVGNESLAQTGAFLGGQASAFKNLKYKEIIIDGKSKQKIVEQLKDKGIDWSIIYQIDKCCVMAKKILLPPTHQNQNIEFLPPYHVINHHLKKTEISVADNKVNQYENSIKTQSCKMKSILKKMGKAGILTPHEIKELQNLNTISPLLGIEEIKAFLQFLDTDAIKEIDSLTSIMGVNKFLMPYVTHDILHNVLRSEEFLRALQKRLELIRRVLGDENFTNLDKIHSLFGGNSISCYLEMIKSQTFHKLGNLQSFQDKSIKSIIALWNICRVYCAFNIVDKFFMSTLKELVNLNAMINNDEKLRYFYDLFMDKFILSTENSPLPEIYNSMPEIKIAHQKDGYVRTDADPEYSIEIISDLCDYLYRNKKYAEARRLTRILCAQFMKCYKIDKKIQNMLWAKNKIAKSEPGNPKLNALRCSICDNAARNIRMEYKLGMWAILCKGLGDNDKCTDKVAKMSTSLLSTQKLMLKFEIPQSFWGDNCM